jgi:hypothetical protein
VAKKQAAKKPASKELEDRIVELRRVRAGDLLPNPENWRTHGDDQMAALDGILGEVGIADAVLAFPADGLGPDGDSSKLMLFDGHARTERDPEQLWPVIVTDLTLDEARLMLAVTDPLAAMAGANEARLNELLGNVEADNEALQVMLDGLAEDVGVFGAEEVALPELASGDREPFQQMTFTLHDEQAETVKRAMAQAKQEGPFDGPNENSNGNALARIAEAYCG